MASCSAIQIQVVFVLAYMKAGPIRHELCAIWVIVCHLNGIFDISYKVEGMTSWQEGVWHTKLL